MAFEAVPALAKLTAVRTQARAQLSVRAHCAIVAVMAEHRAPPKRAHADSGRFPWALLEWLTRRRSRTVPSSIEPGFGRNWTAASPSRELGGAKRSPQDVPISVFPEPMTQLHRWSIVSAASTTARHERRLQSTRKRRQRSASDRPD